MPHINIKYFPKPLSEEQQKNLVSTITQAISSTFHCSEGAVSIALEPIEKEQWNEKVYLPEIVHRGELLCKKPNY
jgi:phenylpyruvate tautomerase PptA (4-oxalocrotonate tautomerase family)